MVVRQFFSETKVFGLLMESLSEASRSEGFYTRIVSGIEDTAYELGYQVLLHVYRPDIDPLDSLRELMGRDIDGLIIANDGDVTPNVIRKVTEGWGADGFGRKLSIFSDPFADRR